jgi:endonuclease YncB( thermonuclease family)
MLKLTLPLLLALAASPALAGETFSGRVAKVADGDTFTLDDKTKVRLWGIDTPEKKQECQAADGKPYPCGIRAQQALEAFALGRKVTCEDKQKGGSYGRRVAACAVDGKDLAGFMVSQGYAVDYKKFSKGAYLGAQRQAQAEKRGIWSGRFQLPEEWRRERRG